MLASVVAAVLTSGDDFADTNGAVDDAAVLRRAATNESTSRRI